MAPSMDFRQGVCTACKNSFRIPATFAADKAKCPKCRGIVEIGPVQSGGGASASSTSSSPQTAVKAPAPAPVAVPAKIPPPKPAPVAASAQSEGPAPAVSSPPPAPPPAAPAKRASPPPRTEPAAPKESVRNATAAAASRVKSGESSEGAERPSTRRAREPRVVEPVNRTPMMIGLAVAIVAVALLGWYFGVKRPADEVAAKEAAAKQKAAADAALVSSVDLTKIPDAARLEQTPEDVWQQMGQLMTTYTTPPFSATAQKAGDVLLSSWGKQSIPAILNGYKRIDVSTPYGVEIGSKIQMLMLQSLTRGVTFGWRQDVSAEDQAFNKRVIQRWFEAWNRAKTDDAIWAQIKDEKK